jgi:cold shock CspA family protein
MNTNTETETQPQDTTTTIQTNVIGCVKWFNNRYGYGFIVATGEHSSYGDVFVHHSELQITDTNVYKFLMQGEYVQFNIVKTSNGKHEFQANGVTGVNGGKLMCENPVQRRPSRRFVEEETHQESQDQERSQPTREREHKPTHRSSAPRKNRDREESTTAAASTQSDGFVLPKGRKPRSTSQSQTTPQPTQSTQPTPYKNAVKNTTQKKA